MKMTRIASIFFASSQFSRTRYATAFGVSPFLSQHGRRSIKTQSIIHTDTLIPAKRRSRLCTHQNLTKLSARKASSKSSTTAAQSFIRRLEQITACQPITSTKSKTIKLYQSLSSKSKSRAQKNMTILEGHRLIIDTLKDDRTRKLYRDILVTEEALFQKGLGEKLVHELERIIEDNNNDHDVRVRLASENVVRAACDTVNPQGVVALVDIPPPYKPNSKVGKALNNEKKNRTRAKLFLLLDGISDPGNVGTLLRSAKAVGAEAVIFLPNSCDVWNPKAIRSGMGASFQVPTRYVKSWDECVDFMKDCGVDAGHIYAATMDDAEEDKDCHGDNYVSKPHYDIDWTTHSTGLVLGKEGPGLSSQLRESVANGQIRSVYVPMEAGIESLNAAVCGSVIMFEYYRQIETES